MAIGDELYEEKGLVIYAGDHSERVDSIVALATHHGVRVIVVAAAEEHALVQMTRLDLLADIERVSCKLTSESYEAIFEEPKPEYYVPVNIFRSSQAVRRIERVLKIPGCMDRIRNKRKTYLMSLN